MCVHWVKLDLGYFGWFVLIFGLYLAVLRAYSYWCSGVIHGAEKGCVQDKHFNPCTVSPALFCFFCFEVTLSLTPRPFPVLCHLNFSLVERFCWCPWIFLNFQLVYHLRLRLISDKCPPLPPKIKKFSGDTYNSTIKFCVFWGLFLFWALLSAQGSTPGSVLIRDHSWCLWWQKCNGLVARKTAFIPVVALWPLLLFYSSGYVLQ